MKPFRVLVRVKNNRLVRMREELGMSITAIADAIGVTASTVCAFENLKKSPIASDGAWVSVAIRIAEFHGVSPEVIWPDEVRRIRARAFQLEASAKELMALPPSSEFEERELEQTVARAMELLPPREVKILSCRLQDEKTLRTVGKEMGISADRVLQIQNRGLRELRKSRDLQRAEGLLDERIVPRFK